jgi:hypothetical protein
VGVPGQDLSGPGHWKGKLKHSVSIRRANWENAHLDANIHRRAVPDWGCNVRIQQHPAVNYSVDQAQAQAKPIPVNEEDRHSKQRIGGATGVGRIIWAPNVLWNDGARRPNVIVEQPSRQSINMDRRGDILYNIGDKECAWQLRRVSGLEGSVVEPPQKVGDVLLRARWTKHSRNVAVIA